MLNLFKNKKNEKPGSKPKMVDLDENPLQEGDTVDALRYNLGRCKIIKDEEGAYWYESLKTGERVTWLKMIDAATECQKVKKADA